MFLCIDFPDGLLRRFHLFLRQALAGHQLHRQPCHFLLAHHVDVSPDGFIAEEPVKLLVPAHRLQLLSFALKVGRLHFWMVRQLVCDLFRLPSGLILQSDLAQRAAALENAARKPARQVLYVLIERPPRLVVYLALHDGVVLRRCPCVAAVHLVARVCLRVNGGTWEHHACVAVLRVPLRRVHDGHRRGGDAAPVQGRVPDNRPVLVVHGDQVLRPLHRLVDGEALLDRRQLLCYTVGRDGCSASGSSRRRVRAYCCIRLFFCKRGRLQVQYIIQRHASVFLRAHHHVRRVVVSAHAQQHIASGEVRDSVFARMVQPFVHPVRRCAQDFVGIVRGA